MKNVREERRHVVEGRKVERSHRIDFMPWERWDRPSACSPAMKMLLQ